MALLRNDALIKHPYLRRYPTNSREWSEFIRALNGQKVAAVGAVSGGVEIVDALPTLPSNSYPEGAIVFLESDAKLYRNTDGSTWSKAVDGGDITAGTVVTNALAAGAVTAAKIDVTDLSAVNTKTGSLTVSGALDVSTSGVIKSGQTAYDTGTGFHIEYNSGTPRISVGNSSGNKFTWNGSTLTVKGNIRFADVESFTPTWFGFSSSPSGSLSYVDLGTHAIIWAPATRFGTSNTSTFTLTGVPEEIRPESTQRYVPCTLLDNGIIVPGVANIETDGQITFYIHSIVSGAIRANPAAWTTSGDKGLLDGTTIFYPK